MGAAAGFEVGGEPVEHGGGVPDVLAEVAAEAVGAADARLAFGGMAQGGAEFLVFDGVRHRGVAHAELQVETRFETAGHGGEHEQGFAFFAEGG